jgi:hypothetical protein
MNKQLAAFSGEITIKSAFSSMIKTCTQRKHTQCAEKRLKRNDRHGQNGATRYSYYLKVLVQHRCRDTKWKSQIKPDVLQSSEQKTEKRPMTIEAIKRRRFTKYAVVVKRH